MSRELKFTIPIPGLGFRLLVVGQFDNSASLSNVVYGVVGERRMITGRLTSLTDFALAGGTRMAKAAIK